MTGFFSLLYLASMVAAGKGSANNLYALVRFTSEPIGVAWATPIRKGIWQLRQCGPWRVIF
jgi:hypothetical protein